MPPTLRSSTSAQSSPTATGKSANNVTPSTSTTPSTTPTRKVPQCLTCKRPRAGHPRSGCPYADSPSKGQSNVPNASGSHLSDALESMAIASPARIERDDDTKAFIKNRRRQSAQPHPLGPSESLLSLSTNSNDIVARLSQPGIFDDTEGEDDGAGKGKASRIVRWQETIATIPAAPNRALKSKTPARSPMPGTLIPPTPESSFTSSRDSAAKMESPPANSIRPANDDFPMEDHASNSNASSSTVTRRAQPLSRTMSAVERDVFISKLSEEATATIYIIPKADVDAIVSKATALKFIAHQVMNDDENDPQALIILGRDEKAVQALLRKVEKENRKVQLSKTQNQGRHGPSTLKTAAGAVVVGAVGAWAGLAFS
ncbi:hypothetical protein BDZ97DRAFT_1905638 [Flammula alnicola]|nr:hypothetical protein BDZ97DRAFT_1905638 [Flammula alnicola]